MTQETLVAYFDEAMGRMRKILVAKNNDYTGAAENEIPDPFSNFTRVESFGITSTEIGFLTRMMDKLARVTTFVHKGILQVEDEKVEDTLLDLANYSILMAAYIKSRKVKK